MWGYLQPHAKELGNLEEMNNLLDKWKLTELPRRDVESLDQHGKG